MPDKESNSFVSQDKPDRKAAVAFDTAKDTSIITPYNICLFVLPFIYFSFLFPFGDFYDIVGDNICQVAYWKILFHKNLCGSVGASAPKSGLIILLGLSYELSDFIFSDPVILVKATFSFFTALLIFITGRIAADIGGKPAGIIAALAAVSNYKIIQMFLIGSSGILFLPTLLIGVWLFSRNRYFWGGTILCLSMTFRIESIAVFAILILCILLMNRKWHAAAISSLLIAATLFFHFTILYMVQGDISRLDAGIAAGYSFENIGQNRFNLLFGLGNFFYNNKFNSFSLMLLPSIFAVAAIKSSRIYLSLTGIIVILFLNAILFSGTTNAERYFYFLIPILTAIGTGAVFYAYNTFSPDTDQSHSVRKGIVYMFISLGIIALLIFGFRGQSQNMAHDLFFLISLALIPFLMVLLYYTRKKLPYDSANRMAVFLFTIVHVITLCLAINANFKNRQIPFDKRDYVFVYEGLLFVQNPPFPENSNVLIEDDIFYVIITRRPDFFKHALAVQAFNVKAEDERTRILNEMDYIYLSKLTTFHPYYYLAYVPNISWKQDPFRKAVYQVINTNKPVSIYQQKLVPIENSDHRLILKIEHSDKYGAS